MKQFFQKFFFQIFINFFLKLTQDPISTYSSKKVYSCLMNVLNEPSLYPFI